MAFVETEKKVLDFNRDAMDCLRDHNYVRAAYLLKRSDEVLKHAPQTAGYRKLKAVTLNNYACLYKRKNQPYVALKYLKKACTYEELAPIKHVDLASTHLNICAIYSQLGKHTLALEAATRGLELMKSCDELTSESTLTTLVIAYHNIAVEYEHLHQYEEAVECYKSAYEAARDKLGPSHLLTERMQASYTDALGKLKKQPPPKETRKARRLVVKTLPQPRAKSAAQPKRVRMHSTMAVPPSDLYSARFITGDRLKPMFPLGQTIPTRHLKSGIAKRSAQAPELSCSTHPYNRRLSVDVRTRSAGQNMRRVHKSFKDSVQSAGKQLELQANTWQAIQELEDLQNLGLALVEETN